MNIKINYLALLVLISFGGNCLAESLRIVELDESFKILHPEKVGIGDVYSALLNSKPYKSTLTAKDPTGLTWIDEYGCITKRLVQFSFPSLWKKL